MKHFLTVLCAVILTLVPVSIFAQSIEQVNTMGSRGDRYRAGPEFKIGDWSVFGNQPMYKGQESVNGFGLSTAGELGLKLGWNELPGNVAVLVELNPNVKVRHFGASYYLDDCRLLINGLWVPYKNRFKPVEVTPPPTPPPAPPSMPPAQIAPPPTELIVTFELVRLDLGLPDKVPEWVPPAPPDRPVVVLVFDGRRWWAFVPCVGMATGPKKDLWWKVPVCGVAIAAPFAGGPLACIPAPWH